MYLIECPECHRINEFNTEEEAQMALRKLCPHCLGTDHALVRCELCGSITIKMTYDYLLECKVCGHVWERSLIE